MNYILIRYKNAQPQPKFAKDILICVCLLYVYRNLILLPDLTENFKILRPNELILKHDRHKF